MTTTVSETVTYPIEDECIIEGFAGPGGMSEGLAMAGIQPEQAIGIEWDAEASATAEAAGHRRLTADISILDPERVAQVTFPGRRITGTHFSPPCQGFSMAGKGKGREDTDSLLQAVSMIEDGHAVEEMIRWMKRRANDDKSALSLEPLRWINTLHPEWITLEQVPAVLPLWEAYARVLRSWGYSVWTGKVRAEQFGVPQTRVRAVLLASKRGEVTPMVPTHSKFYSHDPSKTDAGIPRWVTMAEALCWGEEEGKGLVFCPTNLRPNAAYRRPDQPAPTMAFGHDRPRWVTEDELAAYRARVAKVVEPRVNNQSGTAFDLAWPADRPAPTVAGRNIVTMPGANANRFNGSTKSRNDGIKMAVPEVGVLQSFPADYPWQGSQTNQYVQVGNAVPPRLAMHMASHVMQRESATAAAAA